MGMPKQIADQQKQVEAFEAQVAADRLAATPPEPEAEPTPEPQPAPAPTPVPPPPSDEAALWKQRFLSLQGMYNQQVPSLQRELKEMKEKLETLSQARSTPPEPPKQAGTKRVTDQDVTAFGADLIDVIKRGAQEEVEAVTQGYEDKIKALEGKLAQATQTVAQVTQVQTRTVQEDFFEKLEGRLPSWEGIQASNECQTWLSSRVPGMNYTWNDALVSAAERHDVNAVMEVFDEFFKAHPALRPGQPAPTPPAPRNRSELERQVTPQKTAASAPNPNASKRTYTGKDYENESMQVVRLAQKGKFAEAKALEAELDAALRENRVRP